MWLTKDPETAARDVLLQQGPDFHRGDSARMRHPSHLQCRVGGLMSGSRREPDVVSMRREPCTGEPRLCRRAAAHFVNA